MSSFRVDLAAAAESAQMGIVEPQERLRQLAALSNSVEVDGNIPIKRYYRSGLEMVRMAHVYLQEGNVDSAYILYMKFMTLFVEKIKNHPEYKTVPADLRQANVKKLKEVLPVAEKLKEKLLEKYKREYQQFLEAKRQAEKEREEKRLREERERAKAGTIVAPMPTVIPEPSAPPSSMLVDSDMLDKVLYPNDFPTDPSRSAGQGLLLPDSTKPPLKPAFDRTLKPSPTSVLAAGSLRSVIVPTNTMAKFLQLAARNTAANVETCGILAGRLAQNKLVITHVIVPKQKGTADSCTTMCEEDIFNYQDQQNLITLGWIHTHPSQTAFLSSVDLHTHCSYQMMLEEAIAIVCSPKYQETGFFCLTPSYGLDYISQCRQSGFHPHPKDPPLFMEALHITLEDKVAIEVVDLR